MSPLIQQALLKEDGQAVSLEKIRSVLIKLSRGDLVDYLELGGWFRKVKDPILLEFLKVWGHIEVKGQISKQDRKAELMRVWFFSYEGFTAEALKFMPKQGILWSTKEDLEGLLDYVKLRRLPKL
ncbi:hypothetical protein PN36_08590 [Candidatus Thiomargarita nelsonii]|uniref:Uncharacterized protein n=1 Tax=Candidatus Thiomargarita nelsonii TaxID=1003181 RepID=A0A0A6PKT9_9GAMM|nr:hypothetical protein PN36_08590 [Candidatus Thiomargarita nelsonii]